MAKSRSMTLAPCCESRYTALFCAKLDPHVWAFRPQRKLPTRRLARELRKPLQRQKQAWKCIRTMNQSLSLPDSTVIVIPIMIIIDHQFTNQSINPQWMNQWMNQSISQSSNQSINQSINQSTCVILQYTSSMCINNSMQLYFHMQWYCTIIIICI